MSTFQNIQNFNNTPSVNTGTAQYSNAQMQPQTQQTVSVSTPYSSQIYQYPQASVYNDPNKKAASGVNIYIYNPSAIGAPSSTSTANATYALPAQNNTATEVPVLSEIAPKTGAAPIANTSITSEINQSNQTNPNQKTKRIVILTDEYIKSLESYLRSQDKTIRNSGIKELVKRFEEDNTRYDDPALTALLNIALQDPEASNRLLALSPIAAGSAHGDENSIPILQKLQQSDKIYGQEAMMANKALLKTMQTTTLVPDYSQNNK